MKLTIDELAALRDWYPPAIMENAWAGELHCEGDMVEREGVQFIPSALMRFDPDVCPLAGEDAPVCMMRSELFYRIATSDGESRKFHFDHLKYILKAAVHDSYGADKGAVALLEALQVLRTLILGVEARHD